MKRPMLRAAVQVVLALLLATLLPPLAAAGVRSPAAPAPSSPDELLGQGWQGSRDRLWTTTGDATGFHVLVAEASTGYTWRTAATLTRPGVEADQWIGNACVTVSGRNLVVVYAPRSFTNKGDLFDRGGFTSVVDLTTGQTRHLAVRTSLAYFNPGCGHGESAVLTQGGDDDLGKTGLITLDAATGALTKRIEVPGQLTSAVPTSEGIVGADRDAVVRVARDGVRTVLADSAGVPFGLMTDRAGGLVFMDRTANEVRVRRAAAVGKPGTKPAVAMLARGKPGELGVAASADRKVVITGTAVETKTLPPSVVKPDVPLHAQPSTTGEAAVTAVAPAGKADPRLRAVDPAEAQPVRIEGKSIKTGKALTFDVIPASPEGAASATTGEMSAQDSPDDAGRYCAVPRNDPNTQVYQPKPKQVEWAANMAVKGHLTVQRPANWRSNGLGAYTPQGMFPSIPLKNTTNGQVPAQVLLGVLGQESNLWQATRLAYPGETGNPLVGNYYGTDIYNKLPNGQPDTSDDWDIRWNKADCGYGVSQMTDGMRLAGHEKPGETSLPWHQQKAIATDYAANLAAGLQVLQKKWNELQDAGIKVNNNDPARIENWFLATWAYNSGYHQPGEPGSAGAHGLGWQNNPANPKYNPWRENFGKYPTDFATPQRWPYPEKVLGFASFPPSGFEAPGVEVPFFRPAWWNSDEARTAARPKTNTFCTVTANECWFGNNSHVPDYPGDPGTGSGNVVGEPAGPCAHKNGPYYDLKCWWHDSVTWKENCARDCGNEFIRYDYPQYAAEPDNGASFPPNCATAGLPAGALVIDDVGGDVPAVRGSCARPANAGSFDLGFGSDSARIDLHQLGGGFGAHFWFSHTNKTKTALATRLNVTGTWTLDRAINGWARVLVHIPDHAAHTRQARYEIDLGNGGTRFRTVPTRLLAHKWVSLGSFPFAGTPKVRLSNQTSDGAGVEDVAWDAIAVVPLPGKPKQIIASLGDSYASGEGASAPHGVDYYRETDLDGKGGEWRAACHRSTKSWSRTMTLADSATPVGVRADNLDPAVDHRMVACSGARTKNLLSAEGPTDAWNKRGETSYHEVAQLDSGWVDEDTTLVTLSVGGNDARFADVLKHCMYGSGAQDCQHTTMSGDPEPLGAFQPKVMADPMRRSVETVLEQIKLKAPHAKVVLTGYPLLFSKTDVCIVGIGNEESLWLNDMGRKLNEQLEAAVRNSASRGVNVRFSNPQQDFMGKGLCGAPENIHGVVTDLTPGDNPEFEYWPGKGIVSAQGLHPTIEGAALYAQIVTRTLREFGI
ncbi:golvesin C-terminal-like domain-containing protein [Lentzea chajnantorensis]